MATATGTIDVQYEIDATGQVKSVVLPCWGDPDNTGRFALHAFRGTMTEHRKFGDLRIPTRGAVGCHFGAREWSSGEFFRFQITGFQPVG
jgi:hypothetical protein